MTIEEFDELPKFAKNKILKLAAKQQKQEHDNQNYLETAKLNGKADVVFATPEYAIIKQFYSSTKGFEDDLYTAVYQRDGKWRPSCAYFPTFEDTLFYILGVIKEDVNSHFGEYVSKLFRAL